MPQSDSTRAQIGTLVFATSLIQLANGFFGTLVSLRVAVEAFDVPGLVLSAYFAGFTLGSFGCSKLIERIGHIRAYAAFAGLVAAATAVLPLLVGSLAWVVLRAIVGFGCAGVFVTTESWLSAKALPSERGRVFYLYGRDVSCARAGPAFDNPRRYQGDRAVQYDRRAVRSGTDTGHRGPS